MSKEWIYDSWAPRESIWSNWVKPVLFAYMDSPPLIDVAVPSIEIEGIPSAATNTAIVLDLPGDSGVWAGLALARYGYRPVPLYNALPGPTGAGLFDLGINAPISLVDVAPIMSALWRGPEVLLRYPLPDDAPPVFLLDANRRGWLKHPSPGTFDNRSISFTTDFPSANFLWVKGIREVLLVQQAGLRPQADLAHTLRRWQEAGIRIRVKSEGKEPVPITVEKPSFFGWIWYRVLVAIGLRRAELGGFGGLVPFPGSGG